MTLDESIALPQQTDIDVVELDRALTGLAELDAQQSRIVELRFFAGLTIEDTSEVLGISPATVKRDWVTARAWLFGTNTRLDDRAPIEVLGAANDTAEFAMVVMEE